jgi:hypothetical protein
MGANLWQQSVGSTRERDVSPGKTPSLSTWEAAQGYGSTRGRPCVVLYLNWRTPDSGDPHDAEVFHYHGKGPAT